jgi:hypothetical protein
MLPSASLGLLALLRWIGSIGHTLKSFVLRCILFWPHVLRHGLRRIWPPCSGTDPKDVPKKNGDQARPSFPGSSGCEGYSVIHASRDPNRSSETHLPLEPGSTRVLHLLVGPGMEQSQIAPHSPVSSIEPPSPGSTHLSDRHSPRGSTSSITNPNEMPLPHIPHLSNPLTLTHSRITSAQFAGAPRRSRPQSRPPSPLLPPSHPLPQTTPVGTPAASPGPSRSPSPLPSPLLLSKPVPLPQSSVHCVLGGPGSTQIPDVGPPHDSPEGYRQSSITIFREPPSRSQTEADSQYTNLSQSPSPIQLENLTQFPISGANHWTQEPSDAGSLGLDNARPSNESLRSNIPVLSPNRARSVPLPSHSQVTLKNIPFVDASMNWSDGKKRSIGLMHSEQVSRYVNRGDM